MASCGDVFEGADKKPTAIGKDNSKSSSHNSDHSNAVVGLEVTVGFEKTTSEGDGEKVPVDQLTLDLNLPDDFKKTTKNKFKKPAVLPNLFDVKEDKKISVGGRLITDPSSENYTEFLKGAEIKVEIKTN